MSYARISHALCRKLSWRVLVVLLKWSYPITARLMRLFWLLCSLRGTPQYKQFTYPTQKGANQGNYCFAASICRLPVLQWLGRKCAIVLCVNAWTLRKNYMSRSWMARNILKYIWSFKHHCIFLYLISQGNLSFDILFKDSFKMCYSRYSQRIQYLLNCTINMQTCILQDHTF